jgi:hypothetical protein
MMTISEDRRQQLIQRAMGRSTGAVMDDAIGLLQRLALELISLIGEGGFNALFARSLYITHGAFPWLAPRESSRYLTDDAMPTWFAPGDVHHTADSCFAELKINFEGQSAAVAGKASLMLLLTLTNILADLIGEHLTISVLQSAWNDDASDQDHANKESANER